MNKVFLIGRVGKNPEVKTFDGGGKVANFSLATTKTWKDKQSGEKKEKTTWHNISAGGVKADVVSGYITKGSKIAIYGEIDNREYEKDGKKMIFSQVNMSEFEFCDAKKESDNSYTGGGKHMNPSITSNTDIPF